MFVDFRDQPPPPPWPPTPPPRRISRREEKVLTWVIGFNLLMLLFGPLAGSSVIDALVAIARG